MNRFITFLFLFFAFASIAQTQENEHISTIEFVEVLDNNTEEALFYYQKNWKVLRDMAVESGFIHSYQLLETPYSLEAPFHFILMTTYANQEQYDEREENFGELIDSLGDLKLLNDKKPSEFRKSVFGKENVKHR